MRTRTMAIGAALLALLVLVGPSWALTIGELVAHPDTYDGTAVTVTGRVEAAIPVGSESGFDLRDGAAKVTVVSRVGPPAVGDRLAVTGTVRVFHEGDGGPEENRFPAVIVESSRAPAP
jgi:hypothetical protein